MDCEKEEYLFDPKTLATAAKSEAKEELLFTPVGEGSDDNNRFLLRPLCATDYDYGYIDLLAKLTVTGIVTKQMYASTFNQMKYNNGIYYIIVIKDTQVNRIVASGSLILEKKFIHSCGQRGRIEDIVVDTDYRGKRFGKIIVQRLIALSRVLNCYKISLECKDSNVNWYSSMGFVKENGNSNFMQIRIEK